jgi:hypothetical protein
MVDLLPDTIDPPTAFAHVLRQIDRYIALREEAEAGEPPRPRTATPELAEAADLLEGTTVVLIGGDRRPQSQRALERELRLAELRWEFSEPHESHFIFEPAISRPETSLVLLAIRWSSHSYENVRALCERYGKPFVRLPGGYNPNQVASQIMTQAGQTLRANRVAARA